MIVQNTSSHKFNEYFRIDDIHESNIKPNKLNATDFEKHLARINKGSKRRQRNNHAARLAAFKGNK